MKWPKTFIVVSHARDFLNTVSQQICFCIDQVKVQIFVAWI